MQLRAAVVSTDGYYRRSSGRVDFALNVFRNQWKETGLVEVECLGTSLQVPKFNVSSLACHVMKLSWKFSFVAEIAVPPPPLFHKSCLFEII